MKFSWNQVALAILLVASLLGSGCGGIAASPSVSPLMFLVPGMGQAQPRPVPGSSPLAVEVPGQTLAQAR